MERESLAVIEARGKLATSLFMCWGYTLGNLFGAITTHSGPSVLSVTLQALFMGAWLRYEWGLVEAKKSIE
jgi:hypothetical protein